MTSKRMAGMLSNQINEGPEKRMYGHETGTAKQRSEEQMIANDYFGEFGTNTAENKCARYLGRGMIESKTVGSGITCGAAVVGGVTASGCTLAECRPRNASKNGTVGCPAGRCRRGDALALVSSVGLRGTIAGRASM
jgi:hypothetical protein